MSNESDHDHDHDPSSDTASDRSVSCTDHTTVSDADVRVLLNRALDADPRTCPLCYTELAAVGHEIYDLGCPACRTKFIRPTDGAGPEVAMRTTPVRRMKRRKVQDDRIRDGLAAINGRRFADGDEQPRTAANSDERGRPMMDGGRPPGTPCDRCSREYATALVTTFPHLTDDRDVWWCAKCWAGHAADATPLTKQEALVVGVLEYLDRDVAFAGRVLGRTDAAVRELSRRAHDKLDDPEAAAEMEPMTNLTVVDLDEISIQRAD